MMIGLLWSLGSGTLVTFCIRSPLGVRLWVLWFVLAQDLTCEILLQKKIALCFFDNEWFQIEYLRSVLIKTSTDEYP